MRNLGVNWPSSGGERDEPRRAKVFRLGWTVLPFVFACGLIVLQRHRFEEVRRRAIERAEEAAEVRKQDALRQQNARREREMAALVSQALPVSSEFEAEQHEWEAAMLQGLPWPTADSMSGGRVPIVLPEHIRAILKIEPSEREEAQREEVRRYFRPYSKVLRGHKGQ